MKAPTVGLRRSLRGAVCPKRKKLLTPAQTRRLFTPVSPHRHFRLYRLFHQALIDLLEQLLLRLQVHQVESVFMEAVVRTARTHALSTRNWTFPTRLNRQLVHQQLHYQKMRQFSFRKLQRLHQLRHESLFKET